MSLPNATKRAKLIQFVGPYDGSNETDVTAWYQSNGYPGFTVVSEDEDGLHFSQYYGGPVQLIPLGSYFYRDEQSQDPRFVSAESYNSDWAEVAAV